MKEENLNGENLLTLLKSNFHDIVTASKPLQQYISLSSASALRLRSSDAARYLPPPLYCLYEHACIYKDTSESSLGVTIEGDVSQAQQEFENLLKPGVKSTTTSSDDIYKSHPLGVKLTIIFPQGRMSNSSYLFIFSICGSLLMI